MEMDVTTIVASGLAAFPLDGIGTISCTWDWGCYFNPWEANYQIGPCKREDFVAWNDKADPPAAWPCCGAAYDCAEQNGAPCCEPQLGWACP